MPVVLHVITGLHVGGAEMALYRLITAAPGGPLRHVVAALSPGGVVGERLRDAGVEVRVFDLSGTPVRATLALFRTMRMLRPDVVQTWMYHADLLGGILARLAGLNRVVWGIRTTDVKEHGSARTVQIMKLCARISGWLPRTIVCVAEAARILHVRIGYDAARMQVIPNGFALPALWPLAQEGAALRAGWGCPPGALVIGSLGRFHPVKDQQGFIAAAGMVGRRRADAWFLMVGRGLTADNAQLMDWVAASGCAERFILLGERSDVSACLAAMDVFCLSSLTEGFPNVVGEAMALAVPCVVTDVGDAALLVDDTGVVVAPGQPAALADGMQALLSLTEPERRSRGAAARARIEAGYTQARTCARYAAIYEQIIEKKGTT